MKKLLFTFVLMALAFACLTLYPPKATGQTTGTLTYDVACDGRTFVLNQVDHGSASIQRGDSFVLSGRVFPANTIPEGGTHDSPSQFGPDHEGSVGYWYCRGIFLAGGSNFRSEKIQRATTQYFLFNDKSRLFTEGFEGSSKTTRVILGGIGKLAGAHGNATMERIGINLTGSYNLRIVFTMD